MNLYYTMEFDMNGRVLSLKDWKCFYNEADSEFHILTRLEQLEWKSKIITIEEFNNVSNQLIQETSALYHMFPHIPHITIMKQITDNNGCIETTLDSLLETPD
ncbi:MAG: hypothetical protein CMM25_05385 [Rhodospirillaceae bacterium]|nr:hypothetical protein [Rhodospirillaceae bacterium]